MAEPIHPLQRGKIEGFQAAPWAAAPNDLGPEQTDDAFGERVVVRVPDVADRLLAPGRSQAIRIPNRQVLFGLNRSAIGTFVERTTPAKPRSGLRGFTMRLHVHRWTATAAGLASRPGLRSPGTASPCAAAFPGCSRSTPTASHGRRLGPASAAPPTYAFQASGSPPFSVRPVPATLGDTGANENGLAQAGPFCLASIQDRKRVALLDGCRNHSDGEPGAVGVDPGHALAAQHLLGGVMPTQAGEIRRMCAGLGCISRARCR